MRVLFTIFLNLFLFSLIAFLVFSIVYAQFSQQKPEITVSRAILVSIEPPWDNIDNGVAECVIEATRYAEERGYALIYKVNSYGGFLDPAFNIGDVIYNARVPTIAYVESKALSAGTLIVLPADIIALQRGSIIGAMKPVIYNPITGEIIFVNESKVIEPIIAKATLYADKRGRNTTLVREFVINAVVVDSDKAVSSKVADLEVIDINELLTSLKERVIEKDGVNYRLEISAAYVEPYSCSLRSRFLSILSNTYLSNILLSIGVLGAIFAIASGRISVLPLALALILLSLVSTGIHPNMVSVFLIILGSILLAVELFILPGFGVVGISGIVLLILGFALLPAYIPTGISPREDYLLALRALVIGMSLVLGSFSGIVLFKVIQIRRKKPESFTPIGKEGFSIDNIKPGTPGYVKVEGEYWRAESYEEIAPGDRILVEAMREDGVLIVRKKRDYSG